MLLNNETTICYTLEDFLNWNTASKTGKQRDVM